ncbi:uncharacterized protein CXorf49 homolog [Arvicola amphibius]|uniref:uncharacterized protein CXorf49 homolog n=1 Tax=Arvicola amphibius TaxID=1047088 RepID=UPI001C0A5456|nr:uncharacterized protein CXorf49 homolog [Arvicola amphibius]
MSSNKQTAVEEVGVDSEDGEATEDCLEGPCSLQDLDLSHDVGSSQSSLNEDEVEIEENSDLESGSKLQVQDHSEQSVSSDSDKEDFMACLALVDGIEEMVQQPTAQIRQGVRSRSSSKSCTAKPSTSWAGTEADRNRKDKLGKRLVEVKRASGAPVHYRGAKGGRALKTKKKKKVTKAKKPVPEDIPEPSPDPDSDSDEDNEVQVMRVSICFKNGGQIISSNAMEPGEKIKIEDVQPRGNFHHMTGSLQVGAPRNHASGMGKLGASCSNRKAAVSRGKEPSRPRFPGAAAGGLVKASSKKKSVQEKKALQDAPRFTGRRPVLLWGPRPKAAPGETATFPPITCVSTLESSKKHCAIPLEEPAHGTSRKRPTARNTREALPAARADRGLVFKDTVKNLAAMTPTPESYKIKENARARLPTRRAVRPFTCMHRGEMSSGDPNLRAPQVSANSQLVALKRRGTSARTPAPTGDQDPSVASPLPVGEKHQVPGTLGCQQVKFSYLQEMTALLDGGSQVNLAPVPAHTVPHSTERGHLFSAQD